jgi:protein TonB
MAALFGPGAAAAVPATAEPPPERERSAPGAPAALPVGAATVPIAVPDAAAAGAGAGDWDAVAPDAPALEALAPVGEVEPEEGGRRGRWLLVAAILVALLSGGLLAWYLVGRGAGPAGEGAGEGAGEAEAPRVVETVPAPPAADGEPAAGEEAEAAAGERGGAPAAAPAAGDEAPASDDPEARQREIEERLAAREETLRREWEAEVATHERALQRKLSEIEQGAEPAPPSAPPPAAAPTRQPPAPEPAARPPVEEVAAPAEPIPEPASPPAPEPAPPGRSAPEPAPRPVPAVREGELVTMGPGVQAPQLVRFQKPEYPPIARKLRVQGEVVVSLLVDETGKVIDTRLVRRAARDVGLEEAALEAARKASYRPATKDGVRVKMWTTLRIPFQL